MPVKAPSHHDLFPREPRTFDEWNRKFKYSSTVHFYPKLTTPLRADDPRHSGYAILGPRFFPVSFYSVPVFNGRYAVLEILTLLIHSFIKKI